MNSRIFKYCWVSLASVIYWLHYELQCNFWPKRLFRAVTLLLLHLPPPFHIISPSNKFARNIDTQVLYTWRLLLIWYKNLKLNLFEEKWLRGGGLRLWIFEWTNLKKQMQWLIFHWTWYRSSTCDNHMLKVSENKPPTSVILNLCNFKVFPILNPKFVTNCKWLD